jgi:hypothetical protein
MGVVSGNQVRMKLSSFDTSTAHNLNPPAHYTTASSIVIETCFFSREDFHGGYTQEG